MQHEMSRIAITTSEDEDPMEAHYNKLYKEKKSPKVQVMDNKKQEIFPVYTESESDDLEDYKVVQRHLNLRSGGAKLSRDEIEVSTSEDDIDDWGSKKQNYYGSDPQQKKRTKNSLDEAELEEIDAIRIQNEIFQSFGDEDFDHYVVPSVKTPVPGEITKTQKSEDMGEDVFLAEFHRVGSLLEDVLDPLLQPEYDLLHVDKSAYEFVSTLHKLYNGFRTSFLFFQYLKSCGDLSSHDQVILRLVDYKTAVDDWEPSRLSAWEATEHFLRTKQLLVCDNLELPRVPKRVRFAEESGKDAEKRQITSEMLKNVGLLASRSRKAKTPRTKNRRRFDKASKKHRSQVAQMRDHALKYSGEPTGIRSGVIKSTRFK